MYPFVIKLQAAQGSFGGVKRGTVNGGETVFTVTERGCLQWIRSK